MAVCQRGRWERLVSDAGGRIADSVCPNLSGTRYQFTQVFRAVTDTRRFVY
ncbi:hypothetical protein MHPYR_330003 [uncultured Mycobacterium sp.]|uniref:Uncharacterized protein n=1 Tax=uncultured Mycobacterium sp. TaxID=171292 RepID=A0A1Y5PCV7_9MYCO|nr:hypothetical protein MHPYR_330003 [uncultured Mycobacterium sp.]